MLLTLFLLLLHMQMSLSGFLTFIYPYAQHYSRVENYKLRRKVLRLLNETQKRKKKKKLRNFQRALNLCY